MNFVDPSCFRQELAQGLTYFELIPCIVQVEHTNVGNLSLELNKRQRTKLGQID